MLARMTLTPIHKIAMLVRKILALTHKIVMLVRKILTFACRVLPLAQDSNARAQDSNGRFKKASCNKPTWDQINQQLSRKAFKKACAQGWNAQMSKAGLNSRAQKGMGPNKASGHKGGISRQGSKRG